MRTIFRSCTITKCGSTLSSNIGWYRGPERLAYGRWAAISTIVCCAVFSPGSVRADTPAPPQTVRVCVDNAPHPLYPSLDDNGAAQRAVRIIMENLNRSVVYVRRPIAECRVLAREDAIDAHLALTHHPENVALFRFPEQMFKVDKSKAVVATPAPRITANTSLESAAAADSPLFLAFTNQFYARERQFSENVWSVFERIGLERRLVQSEETQR